jgi:hypothetical protein
VGRVAYRDDVDFGEGGGDAGGVAYFAREDTHLADALACDGCGVDARGVGDTSRLPVACGSEAWARHSEHTGCFNGVESVRCSGRWCVPGGRPDGRTLASASDLAAVGELDAHLARVDEVRAVARLAGEEELVLWGEADEGEPTNNVSDERDVGAAVEPRE